MLPAAALLKINSIDWIESLQRHSRKPILDLDKEANRITRSDSPSSAMKRALMMTQSFKVSSIFTITADRMGQSKEALEKLVRDSMPKRRV